MYKPHVKKLKRLYKRQGFVSAFMWLRWARILRAPYKEIEQLVPKNAKIVDIGCGYGFFTNFLAISGPRRQVIGIDISGERIEKAYKKLKNVEFVNSDIMHLDIQYCDVVVIIHMLHHLPSFQAQEELLRGCYQKLSPGGLIIIGEIDSVPLWKAFCSKAIDHLLYSGDSFHFRTCQNFKQAIEKTGFRDVQIIDCSKGIPFSHKVLVGRKP
jgi:2-polyprenyl-3-methyl-5-hydroxy-6-metoxy-1,4-benzoquinol methylase